MFDGADAGPLGLPHVIEAVGGFGEAVGGPGLVGVGEDLEDGGGAIPAEGEHGSGLGEVAHAVDADEGFFLEDFPGFAIVFGEASVGGGAVEVGFVVGVVGDDDASVGSIDVFVVGAEFSGGVEDLAEVEEFSDGEGVDVDFEEFAFHAEEVDFVCGIGEVGGGTGAGLVAVGEVGDGPEGAGEGHEAADATFGAGVSEVGGHGEGGDDAGDGRGEGEGEGGGGCVWHEGSFGSFKFQVSSFKAEGGWRV